MSAALPLVVRADATPEAGAGHVLRCLALAERWRDEGGSVTFAGSWPEEIGALLAAEGIRQEEASDLAALLALVSGAAAVVDGYGFDAAYHDAVAAKAACTLVIDDVGHLPRYGGDLLLNQNPGASSVAYADAPRERLLGPSFVLFRRGVRARREPPREVRPKGRNVLLALGGGDRLDDWRAVLEALSAVQEDVRFRLLPGFGREQRLRLERLAATIGPGFEVAASPGEAPDTMAWADLAVSAAGVTALELAFLGVPAVLVSVAENQRPTAETLAASGASTDLGRASEIGAETLRSAVSRLLESPRTRGDMSERGRELLDGRGVERVAAAIRKAVDSRS